MKLGIGVFLLGLGLALAIALCGSKPRTPDKYRGYLS